MTGLVDYIEERSPQILGEYRAKLDALEMMKNGVEREHKLYDLSHAAAELGITIPDDIAQEAQECAE